MDRVTNQAVSKGAVDGIRSVAHSDSLHECLDHGISYGVEALKID